MMSLVVVGLDGSGGGAATYKAGFTTVVKQAGLPPRADVGVVYCYPGTDSGIGGACIPFGPGNAISVNDVRAGASMAFQVCIDNDGNGRCGGETTVSGCMDQLFYSHNDTGDFFNPLGPLPNSFRAGCPGGAFRGYVVFICQGVHLVGGKPHVHIARSGTIDLTSGGSGYGDFCSPEEMQAKNARAPAKLYFLR